VTALHLRQRHIPGVERRAELYVNRSIGSHHPPSWVCAESTICGLWRAPSARLRHGRRWQTVMAELDGV